MIRSCALVGVVVLLAALQIGCPPAPDGGGGSVVQAIPSSNISQGDAPLTVLFSGTNSTSPNGGPYQFRWDFADGATAEGAEVTHAFASPGLYTVRLTVTDALGITGVGSVDIRVRGIGVSAQITADRTSGPVPLLVRFDGRGSTAPDDVVRDYYWDFGDGGADRTPTPQHRFERAGTYEVTLRVVTAGGVEDTTSLQVRADVGSASLDFSAGDRATLPITQLGTNASLERLTLELWFKSGDAGGTLATLGGGALVVALDPAANVVALTLNGQTTEVEAADLSNRWRHLALTYNADGIGATVYLDGAPIGTAPVPNPDSISVSSLTLGGDYEGTIAEVRLWSTARTATQIGENRGRRLSGSEAGLERYWPLSEGDGQFLRDLAADDDGVRGATTAAEATDAAWTTDAPPLAG